MWSLLLNPKNLLIGFLAVALGLTWVGYQTKKVEVANCKGELGICQRDVEGYQAEMASANGVIEKLKANLASIRVQMDEWKRIAAEAQDFADRLLAAAESKKDCEVYHAENARLTDEFVDGFNVRVRGKVHRPDSAGDRAAPEVLPPAVPPGADKGDK
jgi:hypothetical protein